MFRFLVFLCTIVIIFLIFLFCVMVAEIAVLTCNAYALAVSLLLSLLVNSLLLS